MTRRRVVLLVSVLVVVLAAMFAPAVALAEVPPVVPVLSGDVPITATTTYPVGVQIADGAHIYNPNGSLTMTVRGVETGQRLATTQGANTVFAPGVYVGCVVFTPTDAHDVSSFGLTFPFRQALYVENGPVWSKSVRAALQGGSVTAGSAKNVTIRSTGDCFNGVYVAGGDYLLKGLSIGLIGSGRCDFIGYGAAVVADGQGVNLTLDQCSIANQGVARTAVAAANGANLVVKNSKISTSDGVLPSDYVPTIFPGQMREVPWVLGVTGNVRTTNLLGSNSKAAYINSSLSSTGWGVLSTDACWRPTLTVINSKIATTGKDGYGTFAIGSATEDFLGTTFEVSTYATIMMGGWLHFGDSDQNTVGQMNTDRSLGLSPSEAKALKPQSTVVNSKRFGIMWASGGRAEIDGATQFITKETTFLDKGQVADIEVDGAQGAKLLPKNGVVFQLMDTDDPGALGPDQLTNNIFQEKTGDVVNAHDQYTFHEPGYSEGPGPFGYEGTWTGDARVTLSNIKVKGDFFNGARGDVVPVFPPGRSANPINLGVFLDNATVTGKITSSTATHSQSTIVYPRFFYAGDIYGSLFDAKPDDYRQLGEVTNVSSKAINNGVLVTLEGSRWVVTGESWLTGLTIDGTSSIAAPFGWKVVMYIGGVDTAIEAGHAPYTGDIQLVLEPAV